MIKALLLAATSTNFLPMSNVPLLDGRCEAAEWRSASRIAASGGYSVRAMQDNKFVYLCVEYPQGSLGIVDIYLTTPRETVPINLHASRKLGERLLGTTGWPKYTWWNERGWSTQVNPINRLNGNNTTFHSFPQREFQLSRQRFGAGEWRFAIEYMEDDGTIPMRFPIGSANNDPLTYLTIQVR